MQEKNEENLDFPLIVERLRQECKVKTNRQVGELLGLAEKTISWRIQNNSVPLEKIRVLCLEKKLDLDYILTGKPKKRVVLSPEQAEKIVDQLQNFESRLKKLEQQDRQALNVPEKQNYIPDFDFTKVPKEELTYGHTALGVMIDLLKLVEADQRLQEQIDPDWVEKLRSYITHFGRE